MSSEHSVIPRDQLYMQIALDLAHEAYQAKEVPVGAVLVRDETILATSFNQRERLHDPTAHAEILAIRAAADALNAWRLTDTTLYVTLEPCAMCAGAIIQSRVTRLVFGTRDPKAGACGSICDLLAETRFNHHVIVDSGPLAEESKHLLQQFFQQLREAQPVTIHC